MILKKLKLSNIRSYKEEEINFPEGIVLLSGDIGAGKSTILLAIEFALFGMSKKGVTGDLLLRHGKHEGSVELHFALKLGNGGNDLKEIIIKRNIRRSNQIKQESGFIIVDGIKTECTPVELKTRILELLGYPQDMVTKSTDIVYRYTVYTPQEQMKQILFEDSSVRLETLRRVFDIDKYKRINQNMDILLKDMKTKRSELSGKVSDIEEKRKLKHDKLKIRVEMINAIEQVKPVLMNYENEIHEKKAGLAIIEANLKEHEQLKQNLAVLKVRYSNLQRQIAENEKRISLLNVQASSLSKDLENFNINKPSDIDRLQLESEIAEEEKQLEEFMMKSLNLKKDIEFNHRKMTEISQEIQEKQGIASEAAKKTHELQVLENDASQVKEFESGVEKLKKFINELDMKIKESQVYISASLKVKREILSIDRCPTCLQDIKQDHKDSITFSEDKKIKEMNLRINEVEAEKLELVKELDGKSKMLVHFKNCERQLDKIKAELRIAENSCRELEKKQVILDELMRIRDMLSIESHSMGQKDVPALKENVLAKKEVLNMLKIYEEQRKHKLLLEKNLLEKHELIRELSAGKGILDRQISEFSAEIAEVESKANAFLGIDARFIQLRKDIEDVVILQKRSELEMARMSKQLEGLDEFISALEKEISEKEEAMKKIAELASFVSWSDGFFQPLMSTMEKHIMMRLYQEFNELFIKWFDTLIDDDNLSAKLDDVFTPVIIQNGYETTVENLSGGERSAVALAYRLALNKVINSFITSINTKDLIILDEPTDGFSQEQLDKIKDVLDELSIRQVLLVSHETKIESFAHHIIRIAKTEHVSCVM